MVAESALAKARLCVLYLRKPGLQLDEKELTLKYHRKSWYMIFYCLPNNRACYDTPRLTKHQKDI
jgi:hypothetical protein